jgi:hypothetical protein
MRPPFLAEFYLIKAMKYALLVGITFTYCLDFAPIQPTYVLDWQKLVPGGLILMLYLLGRFQKQQEQIQLFARFQMPMQQRPYSVKLELSLLFFAAQVFVLLYFNPHLTEIALLQWFERNILSLEKAFLLGFIFQVLGFFFVVGVFVRLLKAFRPKPPQQNSTPQDPNQFTDYEEVSDQHLE